jgi:hypothetical protein
MRVIVTLTPRQAYKLFRREPELKKEGRRFRSAKDSSGVTLKTGAKLYCNGGQFHVGGYAHDGSDVLAYKDYGTVVKL